MIWPWKNFARSQDTKEHDYDGNFEKTQPQMQREKTDRTKQKNLISFEDYKSALNKEVQIVINIPR